MADEIGVLEYGSDVKDGSESPPCEHFLKLRRDLLGRMFFCMKQPRQKNVNVAVSETGGHDEALAVDYVRAAWGFNLITRSNR